MKITSIAFDGMHRCGKGTQIKLLQRFLQAQDKQTFTIRGEYYRDGNGKNNITDPISLWRQEHKTSIAYDIKSQRLQRELRYFYKKFLPFYMKSIGLHESTVLQDRSIVGRYMFCAAAQEDTETIDTIQYGAHERLRDKVIIPDIIFVLQPTQKELLHRLQTGFDAQQENAAFRHAYKKDYIQEKYNKYYDGLKLLPEYILNHVYHIQGDKPENYIHQEILDVLEKRFISEGDNHGR